MANNLKSNIIFLILLGIVVIVSMLFIIVGTILPLQEKVLSKYSPSYVVEVNNGIPRRGKVVNKHLDETNIYMNAFNPIISKNRTTPSANTNSTALDENEVPEMSYIEKSKMPPPKQPYLMEPPVLTNTN